MALTQPLLGVIPARYDLSDPQFLPRQIEMSPMYLDLTPFNPAADVAGRTRSGTLGHAVPVKGRGGKLAPAGPAGSTRFGDVVERGPVRSAPRPSRSAVCVA